MNEKEKEKERQQCVLLHIKATMVISWLVI